MTTVADIRKQYPQYSDLPDDTLVNGFHAKFYSDIPLEEFHKKVGFSPKEEKPDIGLLAKTAIAVQKGAEEVLPALDIALGIPAFIAKVGATGAVDLAAALSGEEKPLEKGSAVMEKAMEAPWMKAMSAPISYMAGQDVSKGTAIGGVMEKLSGAIEKGAESVSEKTGDTELGQAVKQAADIAMLKGGELAVGAVKGIAKAVSKEKPKAPSIDAEQLARDKLATITKAAPKIPEKRNILGQSKADVQATTDYYNKLWEENQKIGEQPTPEQGPPPVVEAAKEAGIPEEIVTETQKVIATPNKEGLVKQADNIVLERINNIAASSRIIKNTKDTLDTALPELPRREAVSEAIDKGDLSTLSEVDQTTARYVQGLFSEIGERAKAEGVIEGLRENYITHIVDWSKVSESEVIILQQKLLGSLASKESVSGSSRFGKERKHATFEDLQEAIKDTGLEIKTKDVAEIYQSYAMAMERAIENKKMIESLKKIQSEDGSNVDWAMQKATEHSPKGWVHIDSPQLRGYVINPELAPMMKYVFEGKAPGVIAQAALSITQAVKRMNVVGSFFHAKSLTEALYGNTGVFSTVSELGKMSYDKMFGTQHAAINKALEQFHKGGVGDSADAWMHSGLKVEIPEDVSIGVIGQVGKVGDELLAKIGPKTTLGEKSLTAVEKATLGVFDKFTWDYLHTGLKLSVAEKMLEKAKQNHPEVPEAQHRLEIARHLNNSFGGLNWFDIAAQSSTKIGRDLSMNAYSPAGRRGLQMLLFAPDWTVSTLRAFSTAFGKGTGLKGIVKPLKQADYARRYQMRTLFIYATLVNGMNMAVTGHPLWDNRDPTRLEFRDGTSMQLMKHAAEPYHWIADPDKTFSNKLGFIPRSMIVGLGGLEYASPTAPKLLDTSGVGRTLAVAKGALPFQASAAIQAPKGEGIKRAISGTLGFPVYGMTEAQRKEKTKAMYKEKQRQIEEWKRKGGK